MPIRSIVVFITEQFPDNNMHEPDFDISLSNEYKFGVKFGDDVDVS